MLATAPRVRRRQLMGAHHKNATTIPGITGTPANIFAVMANPPTTLAPSKRPMVPDWAAAMAR